MPRLFPLAVVLIAAPAFADDPPDLIVHNAKVLTVDAKFAVAQAVAVRGGKVAAVGTDADVLKLAAGRTRGWSTPAARRCCRG